MELDRSVLIRTPALSDSPEAKPPVELLNAHAALVKTANDAAAKAVALSNDGRWSEPERARQLTALADETIPQITEISEVVSAVALLCDESERSELRKAREQFDPVRALAIAQAIAGRSREGKLSALLRARTSDPEAAAAIYFAPKELSVADGLDQRLVDSLKDQLLDSVDPKLRTTLDQTRFALGRLNAGIENATAQLRRLCRVEEAPAARIERVG
jgi:hypothetical protein